MNKSEHPETFGVFKPVGHTVVAFRSADDLNAAARALLGRGFSPAALQRYTPQDMVEQADADLMSASPMASLGQDLNLVKAQRELAAAGCSFLVVHAPGDDDAATLDEVIHASPAVAAQRYGTWIVEELVAAPGDTPQVFESPGRGLDLEATVPPGRRQ